MRKPRRRERRFAAGRRVVGKSSRVAEQTGSGKRVRESALVTGSRAGGIGDRGGMGKQGELSGRASGRGDRPAQRGGGGAQAGGFGGAGRGRQAEAFQGLGKGGEVRNASARGASSWGGERRASGGGSFQRASGGGGFHGGGGGGFQRGGGGGFPWWRAGASMVVAADIGEAGGVVHIRVRGSFSPCPHQDGCCPSNASTMSAERHTGPVSDSRHRSP